MVKPGPIKTQIIFQISSPAVWMSDFFNYRAGQFASVGFAPTQTTTITLPERCPLKPSSATAASGGAAPPPRRRRIRGRSYPPGAAASARGG